MNRMMIGAAMGFVAGAGLMMTAAGRTLRRDVCKGVRKARAMMKDMESH